MRSARARLIAADGLGMAAAFAVAWLLFDAPLLFRDATWEPFLLLAGGVAAWIAAARAAGHHRAGGSELGHDLSRVSGLMTVGAWGICVASWLTGKPDPDVRQLLAFWALAIVAIVLARRAAGVGARAGAEPAPRRPLPTWPPVPAALADCAVLFVVLTACRRWVQEPLPADSTAWAWVFVALSLPAWVAAATALGHYEPERTSIGRDLLGALVLASWGAWLLIALSPYTGEIDPDIGQILVPWALTIAAVPAARLAARATLSSRSTRPR